MRKKTAKPKKELTKKTEVNPIIDASSKPEPILKTEIAVETAPTTTIETTQPTSPPSTTTEDQKIEMNSQAEKKLDPVVPSIDINSPLKVEENKSKESDLSMVEKKGTFLYILGVILTLIIIAGSILIFFFSLENNKSSQKTLISPEENTPKQPQASPTPYMDKTKWSLEVWNGSGIPKAAAKAAEKLQSLGYTNITTGNAGVSNYKNTNLYISKNYLNLSNLFWEDVKKEFPNATISGELTDSTSSARIIIGR